MTTENRTVTLERQATSRKDWIHGVQWVGSPLCSLREKTPAKTATTQPNEEYPQGLPRGGRIKDLIGLISR